jgi:hypothetical protein
MHTYTLCPEEHLRKDRATRSQDDEISKVISISTEIDAQSLLWMQVHTLYL